MERTHSPNKEMMCDLAQTYCVAFCQCCRRTDAHDPCPETAAPVVPGHCGGRGLDLSVQAEPGRSILTYDVSDDNCPPAQLTECKRGMKWSVHYAHIYDTNLGRTYLCDTKTDGGGWIVVQRRVHRTTKFYNDWYLFKHGFGPVCDDYWLGNKYMHQITSSGKYELRIDIEYRSATYYAQYANFSIDDEEKQYALHIAGFKGNLRDDLSYHDNMMFSTKERDNDNDPLKHCANYYRNAWWYNNCHLVNLNGYFITSKYYGFSVLWKTLTGYYTSVSAVEMKIRKKLISPN
ncbi:Ficolin-1 [Bulinus truncatus]|nr:Ficolin-1 [Bulinus truncatus]